MPVRQSIPASRLPGNPRYVNAVGNFVNGALRRLPGFIWLNVAAVAAATIMIIVGGFGTGALPAGTRIAFWALLLGWSAIKWQVWFALLVRKPADWWRAALLGSIVLNLALPLEIGVTLALIGVEASISYASVWFAALAISAVLYVILALVGRTFWSARAAPPSAPALKPGGLLERAGLRGPQAPLAIVAEDHYCRVHLADGSSTLIYFRFRDALEEVQSLDGSRVHRGAWLADASAAAARRVDRRWIVELTSGAIIPVSARYVPELRRRGWHRRSAAASKA